MAVVNSFKVPSVLFSRLLTSSFSSGDRRSIHLSNQLRHDEFDNKLWYDPGESAERRTLETLKVDFRRIKRRYLEAKYDAYRRKGILSHPMRDVLQYELLPYRTTFCIIGGGIVGSSIAYWIKQRARSEEIQVTVIERDDTVSFLLAELALSISYSICLSLLKVPLCSQLVELGNNLAYQKVSRCQCSARSFCGMLGPIFKS